MRLQSFGNIRVAQLAFSMQPVAVWEPIGQLDFDQEQMTASKL